MGGYRLPSTANIPCFRPDHQYLSLRKFALAGIAPWVGTVYPRLPAFPASGRTSILLFKTAVRWNTLCLVREYDFIVDGQFVSMDGGCHQSPPVTCRCLSLEGVAIGGFTPRVHEINHSTPVLPPRSVSQALPDATDVRGAIAAGNRQDRHE